MRWISYTVWLLGVAFLPWVLLVVYVFEPIGTGGFALSIVSLFGGCGIVGLILIEAIGLGLLLKVPDPTMTKTQWAWRAFALTNASIGLALIWTK